MPAMPAMPLKQKKHRTTRRTAALLTQALPQDPVHPFVGSLLSHDLDEVLVRQLLGPGLSLLTRYEVPVQIDVVFGDESTGL